MAFQLDTSEQGYSPDPSSRVGSKSQTRSIWCQVSRGTWDKGQRVKRYFQTESFRGQTKDSM